MFLKQGIKSSLKYSDHTLLKNFIKKWIESFSSFRSYENPGKNRVSCLVPFNSEIVSLVLSFNGDPVFTKGVASRDGRITGK